MVGGYQTPAAAAAQPPPPQIGYVQQQSQVTQTSPPAVHPNQLPSCSQAPTPPQPPQIPSTSQDDAFQQQHQDVIDQLIQINDEGKQENVDDALAQQLQELDGIETSADDLTNLSQLIVSSLYTSAILSIV